MAANISHENWENQVGKINSELSQKMLNVHSRGPRICGVGLIPQTAEQITTKHMYWA